MGGRAMRRQAEAHRELERGHSPGDLEDLGKLADIIERKPPAAMDAGCLGDLLARLHRIVIMHPRSRCSGRDHLHLRDRGDVEHLDPGLGHGGDHHARAVGLDGIGNLAGKAFAEACRGGAQGLRRETEDRLLRVQGAGDRRAIGMHCRGMVEQGAGMDVHGTNPLRTLQGCRNDATEKRRRFAPDRLNSPADRRRDRRHDAFDHHQG